MRKRIDLNVDLAEGFAWDDDLLGLCSTANICTGAHAGSVELAAETAARCRARGVRPSLHIGYADRAAFGRTSQPLDGDGDPGRLLRSLLGQAEAFRGAAAVKPHGALYHDTAESEAHAAVLIAFLIRTRLPLIGFPIGRHKAAAGAAGCPFLAEGFVDRREGPDGRLAPRSQPGAVLESGEEAAANALRLAPGRATLCLHGDTPGCVSIAEAVRRALLDDGWEIGA